MSTYASLFFHTTIKKDSVPNPAKLQVQLFIIFSYKISLKHIMVYELGFGLKP